MMWHYILFGIIAAFVHDVCCGMSRELQWFTAVERYAMRGTAVHNYCRDVEDHLLYHMAELTDALQDANRIDWLFRDIEQGRGASLSPVSIAKRERIIACIINYCATTGQSVDDEIAFFNAAVGRAQFQATLVADSYSSCKRCQ